MMKRTLLMFGMVLSTLFAQSQVANDYRWMAGTWRGPGFGGQFEEVWSDPDANGVVIGMFRFWDAEGQLQFYEFWVLDETGLRLKHFNPDFVGWEEKDGFIHFKMVSAEPNLLTLQELVYALQPDGTLKISLDMKRGGVVSTEVFELKKVE